jgi:hypothetical protein
MGNKQPKSAIKERQKTNLLGAGTAKFNPKKIQSSTGTVKTSCPTI